MDRHLATALDRWLTTPPDNDIPEDAYHAACEGEGCEGCGNTGIDPVKEQEYIAQAKADTEAQYAAWAEVDF